MVGDYTKLLCLCMLLSISKLYFIPFGFGRKFCIVRVPRICVSLSVMLRIELVGLNEAEPKARNL